MNAKHCSNTNTSAFPCNACGQCCRRVAFSEQTAYLDRGDGTCRYFDDNSHLCTIYETRPLVCRVEDYYKQHLSHIYDWEEFVKLNLAICESFKENK